MLKGAAVVALPVSVPPPEFQIVTLAVIVCPAKLASCKLVLERFKAGVVL
jgi:hypothetical protein